MSDCVRSMLSDWEAKGAAGDDVEIELSRQFEELTADVISHTAFGSSYKEGRQVFLAQRELQFLAFSTAFNVQIPGFRYLPTEKNLRTWKLDKQVRSMLMDIIKTRLANKDTAGYGNDLLGLMLEACTPEHGEAPILTMDEIIDECKTFFFAGHDTTSHLLTWASFLLSTHPAWQDKLREEVRRECGDGEEEEELTGDMLNKLKLVNMFLLETLRLYGPVPAFQRRTSSDLDLGGIHVPEGAILTIAITSIHRDKEVWGEDAGEFKPERFENGVTKAAKHPNALLSFSSGPRSCIGQNFAMMEAKAVVAMMVQKFSLELSPKYVHAPMNVITVRPRHGLPMILEPAGCPVLSETLVPTTKVAAYVTADLTRQPPRGHQAAQRLEDKYPPPSALDSHQPDLEVVGKERAQRERQGVTAAMGVAWMVAAAVVAVMASWAFNALVHLVWRPYAITRKLAAQGVAGPGYRFFSGNLGDIKRLRGEGAVVTLDVGDHDFIPMVQPHFRKWISLYGRTFVYWTGARPNVCVADVNVVKQVLFDRTGLYPKNLMNPHISRLLGKGLVLTDGDDWKRHRKVVHPAFSMDKLKVRMTIRHALSVSMMSEWEAKGVNDVEVELSSRFEELTADVISHTAFGSSYIQGKKVFLAQRELQFLAFSTVFDVQIPAFRYLPTDKNLKTWKLDKQVRTMLMDIIKTRLANKDTAGYGNDLLGLMLEACAPEHGETPLLSMDEIIDECKTFFFAGHDTTSHLLTWASFLLSTHPEWQDRLREEVRRECGDEVPTGDMLNKLKLVNMFLLETLRLYGPVSVIQRKASSDLDLGGVQVPEGAILTIPIATIHRDKEVWGEDAGEFRPERFENGVTRAAKHPNALLSFSSGPRSCIGQNFAMIEAKAVVAMILQRFTLELSPKYVHAPMDVLTGWVAVTH
ncbi:hypothetical protein HU200_045942 [Digitaria exilis]|uniref:Cytochrome P450 n=1 Tax=Digitaria exilis TaxID=1010633 RepID=A0A835B6Y3_9POAL|nr:hypothetical protein HU200_045942 [Digitaria exilis]